MKDYVNERWRAILTHNDLSDFESLWALEAPWFEPPNRRRGGWSGVSRYELEMPEGGRTAIFIKRQENHGTPSISHPLRGVPTFLREFKRIMNYRRKNIPTLVPVFFAQRDVGNDQRAILVTEELSGFVSLADKTAAWQDEGVPPRAVRHSMLTAVADVLRGMHRQGIQHSCFFQKHVFVKVDQDGRTEARVIDLEKSRWRPMRTLCAMRDLYSLSRFSSGWSSTDQVFFLKEYLAIPRLNTYAKWLWRNVESRSIRKRRITPRRSVRASGGAL